jgi:hypothetical protein
MLIAIVTYLTLNVFGGSGFEGFFPEGFDKQINKQITDSQRVEQVEEITNQIEKDAEAYNKLVNKTIKEILEVDANYHATAVDYHQLTAKILAERQQVQTRFIEGRMQIKTLITEVEWAAIFSQEIQE